LVLRVLLFCAAGPAGTGSLPAHADAPPGNPERSARMVRREVPARKPAITHVCCPMQRRSAAISPLSSRIRRPV